MKKQMSSNKSTRSDEISEGKIRLFSNGLGAFFAVVLTSVWVLISWASVVINQPSAITKLIPYAVIPLVYLVLYSVVTTRIEFGSTSYKVRQIIKRFFDILITALGLFFLSPLLILLSIVIRLDSPGPVLYRTKRVGQFGRLFDSYQFRITEMSPSETKITRTGKFLHRFSLDHLPWLYNVLEGEMSLVGPIPRRVNSFHTTIDPTDKIYKLKPGITGLWQVSRPYSSDQIRSDLEYVENWSLSLDAKIMFRTIWVVILSNK